ncbi:MAG: dihydrolipoyl dehydrogenase [Bacteroidota bacterium]|nr:dihydrolipoyl dehydrogenase [Bacteroidota bacterium]
MSKVLVIGSGPGGYVAAIRAAQLGMEVTLVEKYAQLGGTCLHVGCIPSKALLDSSEHFYNATHRFEHHGILASGIQLDFSKMMARKNQVILQNAKGIEYLMKKNKINFLQGHARFVDSNHIELIVKDQIAELIAFDYCIIATGSKPMVPPNFTYDKKRVITSTEVLSMPELPKSMIIVGAGVIGVELGSVFARLGTQVEIIEYMDGILPGMDRDCAAELYKSLVSLGIKFSFGQTVEEVKTQKNNIILKFRTRKTDKSSYKESDYCLVAIGRTAYIEGLQTERVNIKVDGKGKILVDEKLCANNSNIYAIGDVIAGPMLAHKAEEEGVYVAELLANQKPHINYALIPNVVYTWPELAGVGYTEEVLTAENRPYKTGKFPFKALGRARASMDLEGLVKVITDSHTDELLGVHICGPRAADLIMEAASLLEFRASAEDMSRISHPHPTFSEALKEAALDATGKRAIHI